MEGQRRFADKVPLSSDLEDKVQRSRRKRIPGRGISICQGPGVRVREDAEKEAECGERGGQEIRLCRSGP